MNKTSNNYNEKVSIIIPVYKVEKFLAKCIDSLLCQTYKNIEIILVNDGSPDNSASILNEYAKKDSRVIVIHKENGGVSSARNAGLNAATGEYITFVDSDDTAHPNYVEYLYNLLKNNNARICSCGHFRINSETQEIFGEDVEEKLNFIPAKDYCLGQVSVWCVMIHKSLLDGKNGPIRFDERYNRTEDILFLCELIANLNSDEFYIESTKRLYYYVFYRVDSLVHIKDEEKLVSMYEHLYEDFKRCCGDNKKLFQSTFYWMAYNYVFLLNAFIDNGHCKGKVYRKAKRIVRRRLLNILFSNSSSFYKKRLLLMAISPKLYGKLKSRKKR